MKVYSIRDCVADIYSGLYMFTNDAVAIRWFNNMISSDDFASKIRNDMQLFRVGEFDQDTGLIEQESPTLVVKGADYEVSE